MLPCHCNTVGDYIYIAIAQTRPRSMRLPHYFYSFIYRYCQPLEGFYKNGSILKREYIHARTTNKKKILDAYKRHRNHKSMTYILSNATLFIFFTKSQTFVKTTVSLESLFHSLTAPGKKLNSKESLLTSGSP